MVLGPSGKLLLQLINYDRVLDKGIQALPTIETDKFSFVRNYQYDKESHLVNFESILTIKSRAESIRNRIPLYPLRQAELRSMLTEAGFSSILPPVSSLSTGFGTNPSKLTGIRA